jgi:hypothetical protein
MIFNILLSAAKKSISGRTRAAGEFPLETEARLNRLHARAPIDAHLGILFQDARVGDENFADLYRRCLKHTGTAVTPFNVFQRFHSRQTLVAYFLATLSVPGARAECGVYRGATALLLCHAWRSRQAAFRGGDFYLIDSYAGASVSGEPDLIAARDADGTVHREAFFPAGKTDTSPALVRGFFGDFPDVRICAGWIPQVFATLPERDWAFVHLDVTLYAPTLAALEYFYPRLHTGGVILCDDYGSIFCPGSQQAWDEFCARHDIAFVVLGNRQSVIIK